ncbi:acyl-CoA thioesterase [Leptospira sp. GIMC2001]|uniref:acyl-CoA thioesterase n=1 Tax=Leptospira sp. GIMC2001 TaxID=1513297 RepID=UPI00234914A9|nr:hotdog domain-containing protein [Leptospira sp. GIMC2001]WCL50589.1 acyl-CoA thioesterase [Leptospira sp. GIMC2001]
MESSFKNKSQESNKLKGMELVTQHLVQPGYLNYHGNLFGGAMLSWLDEGVAMYAMGKIQFTNIVTANMKDVKFKSPGKLGDIIQIYAKIERVGKASIDVKAIAISNNPEKKKISEIIDCMITYVCLDAKGKPFPYFKTAQWESISGKDYVQPQAD